jgi:chromosomal replication initiator protein
LALAAGLKNKIAPRCRASRLFHVMLSPKLVQDIVAKHFGLTRGQLLGRRRLPRYVMARHLCMLLCLEMVPHASLSTVGCWFGGRDHTTVLHARDQMRRRIAADRKFAKQVESLRRMIQRRTGPRG